MSSQHHWRPGLIHNHLTTALSGPRSISVIPPTNSSSSRKARSRNRRILRSDDNQVPRFLIQTTTDIRRKFFELENLQNERLHESLVTADLESPWRIDESLEVRSRNRYSNITAWERNRVRLNVPPEHCDYINASPIKLRSRKDGSVKRYIATQGPKEGQFNHLWRMIWQETGEVAVIVMLTKTFELGHDKCFQYFPENDPEPWQIRDDGEFGDGFNATIRLLERTKDRRSSCTIRKLLLEVGNQSKVVWHFLFKGWPDYNVPEGSDKVALLELIRLANEKNSGPENPLIVHCSAGVGRSGTFITLDHFVREMDSGAVTVDDTEDLVFDVVNCLREQRMYMVQSQVQFEFIYQVLREQFQKRSKSSSPRSSGNLLEADDDEEEADG